ncbi:MAG: hypothetical protein HWN65_04080 [Candidatus Helarchaeota archaeon]|nr:hypothetical protein [Candidatus Helarchaeota archaeon]
MKDILKKLSLFLILFGFSFLIITQFTIVEQTAPPLRTFDHIPSGNPLATCNGALGPTPAAYNYSGAGPSYPVLETFNETAKLASTQAGLSYGTNISLGLSPGYPSQNASRVFGTVTSLVENHPGAFDNDFSGGWEDWTAYEYDAGSDGGYMNESHVPGSPQYVQISMDGQKNPQTTSVGGFDAGMDGGGYDWTYTEEYASDVGDSGTGTRLYGIRSWSGSTNYYFYLHEQGYATVGSHDTWCNYGTIEHADYDLHVFKITSPSFQHGIQTGPEAGNEITGATLTVRWNVHSPDFDDPNNDAYLDVKLSTNGGSSYTSHRLWTRTGNNPSGWYVSTWDVGSIIQATSFDTNLKIQLKFFVYLASSNSGDPEYLSCDIDYVTLEIDYNESRKFSAGSIAGLQSDSYNYSKDTQAASFSFDYKLSQNWDDVGGNTHACDHTEIALWMSNTSTGSPAWVWVHSLDDDGFFVKDNTWRTISSPIDLTTGLGQDGAVPQFYFRLAVHWKDNWGPLTNDLLTVDFDNLEFDFTADILPEEAQLYIYDATYGGPDIPVQSLGYGSGYFDSQTTHNWTGTFQGGATPDLQWVIKNPYYQGASVSITHGDIFMEESYLTNATTRFSCKANSTNTWYFDWNSAQKQDDARTSSEQMEITGVPSDWGDEYVNIFPSDNGESAYKAGAGTFRISNSHSNTLYTLAVSSPNKLYEQIVNIRSQENSTATFIDWAIVYPTNFTRIRVRSSDDNGYLNMTLWQAARNGTELVINYSIEHREFLNVGTSESYSTPWQIPIDAVPGQWLYVLQWNNSLIAGQVTEVGHVIIPLEIRRRTVATGVIFGKKIAGQIGYGNSSINAVNRTLDLGPLLLNITWTDLHSGSGVTYYDNAYINITGDYGPPDPSPYDDRSPYTIVQKNLTRMGDTFYYEISQTDYETWCYTGLHNFTIVLESESTEFNGTGSELFEISGSFYVITNINMTLNPLASLTDPPSYFSQGELLNFKIDLYDVSHSIPVDNNSPFINSLPNPWMGAVHPIWELVFSQQYANFSKGGVPGTSGPLFPTAVPGSYNSYITLNPQCDPVSGLNPFPSDYYYFNLSAIITKNEALNWEAEIVYCKNNTLSPDLEPYRMSDWGRIEVGSGPSLTIDYPSLDFVFSGPSLIINGTAYGGGQIIDTVQINDSRFTLTQDPQGNATAYYEFQNTSIITEGPIQVNLTINTTGGLTNELIWWFYFDISDPTINILNPAFDGVNVSNSIINISGYIDGTGSNIANVAINDSRFGLFRDPSLSLAGVFEFCNTTNIPDGYIAITVNTTDSAGLSTFSTRRFKIDNTPPSITLDDPQNQTLIHKPNFINLTISDNALIPSSVQWKANVTETIWTTAFNGSYDINLGFFASDQTVQFWVKANDSAGNTAMITIILSFDDTPPLITLNTPANGTVVRKPTLLNLTIYDPFLDPLSLEWKANVTQTTWTNTFIGFYYIDLAGFSSNQPLQFWVRANDSIGNAALNTFILVFDDILPSIVLHTPQNNSIIQKPSFIDLTISDTNLDSNTAEWRDNVSQTDWTNFALGYYDIDLLNVTSNQAVQYWVRANDTADNYNWITFFLTFDDTPPPPPVKRDYTYVGGNLTLRWTGSPDTVYYQVRRNGITLGNTTNDYFFDLSWLNPGDYEYEIIPFDEANNMGEALTIQIRIQPDYQQLFIILAIAVMAATAAIAATSRYYSRKRRKDTTLPPKMKLIGKKEDLLSAVDLNRASDLIEGASKQDIERLIHKLLDENKIQGVFEGDFFIIQSNVDVFVKYLQNKHPKS